MNSFKKIKVIAVLSAFIFFGMAAVQQPKNDKFKNLQVLPKDITEDSLDKIMDRFTVSLGVDCKFCHVQDKKADSLIFDKDDKGEKEITRNMMRMTTYINKNYFQFYDIIAAEQVQAVTCKTCHRGEPRPAEKIGPR